MTEHHWLGHRDGGRADAPAAEAVAELAAQHSQTATLIGAMGRERYAEWVEDEAFVERVRPAVPVLLVGLEDGAVAMFHGGARNRTAIVRNGG